MNMHADRFVESYFDAWNRHNPEGVADHLARNGIYCDIPEAAERNHDELIESLEAFFSRYRHRYELTGEVLTSADAIAFQYRMIPAGNDGGVHHGAEFITLSGDGALLIRDYYDVPGVAGQPVTPIAAKLPERRVKYAKSGLGEEQMLEYGRRLDGLMRMRQLYLKPDVTLPGLAGLLGCSVNHLSQVINAGFGMSFFDYLNQHRIEYAKRLLRQRDGSHQAITNIAYSVGFKSNSAFYSAFKKHVGQTPARYRQQHVAGEGPGGG